MSGTMAPRGQGRSSSRWETFSVKKKKKKKKKEGKGEKNKVSCRCWRSPEIRVWDETFFFLSRIMVRQDNDTMKGLRFGPNVSKKTYVSIFFLLLSFFFLSFQLGEIEPAGITRK